MRRIALPPLSGALTRKSPDSAEYSIIRTSASAGASSRNHTIASATVSSSNARPTPMTNGSHDASKTAKPRSFGITASRRASASPNSGASEARWATPPMSISKRVSVLPLVSALFARSASVSCADSAAGNVDAAISGPSAVDISTATSAAPTWAMDSANA